jgi:uncharacterized membrane protein
MTAIKNYFNDEKAESLLFIAFGIFAIFFAIDFFFFFKEFFWKGVAIPLFLFSLVQLVIGTTIFLRSPKDNFRVEKWLENEPEKIQSQEVPRMEKVIKNFVLYRYFEIVMIFSGLILMYSLPNCDFWRGFGSGLFMQCFILLSLDFFAEKRGHVYLNYLYSIN